MFHHVSFAKPGPTADILSDWNWICLTYEWLWTILITSFAHLLDQNEVEQDPKVELSTRICETIVSCVFVCGFCPSY